MFVVQRAVDPSGPTDDSRVADLLLAVAPPKQRAAATVDDCELALLDDEEVALQLAFAEAPAEYRSAVGYDTEIVRDICLIAVL